MSYTVFFVNAEYFRPIAFFAVLNSLLSGLILVCLGFIAVYIGNTHNEVLKRPLYIIREKINIDENTQISNHQQGMAPAPSKGHLHIPSSDGGR